jgi:uncharacterized protein (TIGR03083 family)
VTGDELLADALRYALQTVPKVTAEQLTAPTPCRDWDLRQLLLHACDSVAALTEGLCAGQVGLDPPLPPRPADPVGAFTATARRLLVRCETAPGSADCASRGAADGGAIDGGAIDGTVSIGGCPMSVHLLSCTGAVEIAVHAWDVGQSCGGRWPIPEPLAGLLLPAAVVLVCDDERPGLFAPPVWVPAAASAGDRLAAVLGRAPRARPAV